MTEQIHLENHHSAISKIITESDKTHQKMFKPFGEMLLGAGDVQGAKHHPSACKGGSVRRQRKIFQSPPLTKWSRAASLLENSLLLGVSWYGTKWGTEHHL